jgi:putative salt-induced outer membrane protein
MALLVLVAPFAVAQEQESPWAGTAKLGYLATSGNTDNSNLNAGFTVSYSVDDWKHSFAAVAISSADGNTTTAEAYEAGWKSERNLSEKSFLFGQLDWRKDRFSGFATQFSQTVGYGRRLIDSDVHKLNGEIGFGARQSELTDGTDENEAIIRAGLDYTWQLSETAAFTQVLTIESGSENTYTESVTAISAQIVGNLALVGSYTIKNNTDVLPLIDKTDTYTAISLEYTF